MALYKSSNPILSENTFTKFDSYADTQSMTIQGTVNKMGLLLFFVVISASVTWYALGQGILIDSTLPMISGIAAFVVAIVLAFKQTLAPFLAPVYAILKGCLVGFISYVYNQWYSGIVTQALALTICIFVALLLIYKLRIIRVTENFKLIIGAATMGIALFYLVSFALSFFSVSIPLIHSNGIVGIGFSLFVVAIAALNLVVDFDFIEQGAEMRAPKYMEWYAAFGLLVTLIWLYLEILRLLSKLQSRD
ncbi:MAG TPA: Bax inhibitor-1/YccA family protein [Cytophagales bacterium]|nr:Bax inhibitor-1/YccA family protein [Cytophagales bacterium]